MKNIFFYILILVTITLQSAQVPEATAYLSQINQSAKTLKCQICHKESENYSKFGKTVCDHIFHIDCIGSWTSDKNTCPICRALIKTNTDGLIKACIDGNADYVRLAIDQKINLNFRNSEDKTPLTKACYYKHEEIIILLINAGADINLTNENNHTALRIAVCEEESVRIVDILLRNGADPLLVSEDGISPLMLACSDDYHSLDIVNLLLAKDDSNINAIEKTEFQLTALHYACQANHIDLIKPLLDHGADIYLDNANGVSSYDIAEQLEDNSILNIFNEHLAALEEQEESVEENIESNKKRVRLE